MATLLGIEASAGTCSVAVSHHGAVFGREVDTPRAHNEHILPLLETVLGEAGIGLAEVEVFACGQGPGSFTGVRLAAAVIEGLALAHGRPVAMVCSLRALARRASAPGLVDVAVDARMGHVYVARFARSRERVSTVISPALLTPDAALTRLGEFAGQRLGSGWPLLGRAPAPVSDPRARELLEVLDEDLRAGTAELGAHVELPWLDGARHWRKQQV